jgi:cell division initiation protein
MSYTPVELRHVQVGRSLLGYNRGAVERILDEVADSFETVWRDRGELADQVETLELQLNELKAREQLLTRTLASAEQVASDVKDQAKREAAAIVAEAHQEARSVWLSAQVERDRLLAESKRIEVFLRAALEIVAEGSAVESAPEVGEPPTIWPRGDTSEHAVVDEPDPALETDAAEADEPEPESKQSRLRFLPQVVGGESRGLDWGN